MSFQEFQKAPNRLTPRDIGFFILTGIVLILVLYGLASVNYYLANRLPESGEFYLLRTGGQAFLFNRLEPYSGSVAEQVQVHVYGQPAVQGEDPYILDIPFHLLILFFPLAVFPEVAMARAFWMALLEIALMGFIYFNFRSFNRRVPYIFIGFVSLAAFSSYYAYRAFLEGSPSILLGLAYVGIALALYGGFDEVAGALMVFSAIQLEIGGLFLFFVTLWAFWEKRWRVFLGAGMLAFILLVISLLLYPGWFLPFIRAAWNSFKVGFGYSIHDILFQAWPQWGGTIGWVLTAVLIVTLGSEWRATRGADVNRFLWTMCFTLAATPLLGQHIEMDQLVPLSLPVMMVILVSRERWKKLGNGIAILLLLLYFGLPWLIYLRGVPQLFNLDTDQTLFILWPVLGVLGLYWVRWWMVRPPRTWFDDLPQME